MSRMYTKKVIEYFTHPKNVGEIKNADAEVTEGSLACGDLIRLYLRIDPKTRVIKDIKFKSYGCAANIATTSIMTEIVKGKTIGQAKKLEFKDITKALGGLPPIKIHCSVLAIDALKSAIRNYEEKHGLAKPEDLNESILRSRLRRVMDPKHGKDIVTRGIVQNVKFEKGVVKLLLEISKDDESYEHIMHEIEERIAYIPGVNKVEKEFIK
ncbi:MAG: iron-sulfur cluster assembly scaffold protein [Candidatus Aenigmatarchaeota archaeon]|nr:MAG: iron-sulfur cluster assembly scaffold protein [Candidatus Aenigmarchaeota archaeon]